MVNALGCNSKQNWNTYLEFYESEGEGKRETDQERERQRQRDRERKREGEKETKRKRDGQREREREILNLKDLYVKDKYLVLLSSVKALLKTHWSETSEWNFKEEGQKETNDYERYI